MGANNPPGKNQPSKLIEIVWIDANINSDENNSYKNQFINDKHILNKIATKVSPFVKVEEAIEYLKKLKFIPTLIISSGRLYPKFIKIFKNNIKDFSICPKIIIFCGDANSYLTRNKDNHDLLLNHSFYNSGGVKDSYQEVRDFLIKDNYHNDPHFFEALIDFEEKLNFEFILNENQLILPLFLYDYLKKPKEEDILKFNDFSLRNFENVKILKILFEQLFEVKNIPHEILYKYWLKAFFSDSDFSSYINEELQTDNFENNFIFVQILYEGLKLNKPTLEINNNTNLYKYSSLEKVKIDNMNIILSKEKSNMPFILIYTKSFLTFYFNENDALKNSYKPNNNVLFVIENAKDNLNNFNLYTTLDECNNSKKNQILFLPYTFLEIIKTEKKPDNNYIIYLGCIDKYKDIFKNENPKFLPEKIPQTSNITKNIIKYNLLDEEYKDMYNIVILEYRINESNEYTIFGDGFVENNKDKCYMLIDGQKFELKSEYTISDEQKKNLEKLTIKLVGLNKITDMSDLFNNCQDLINIINLQKLDTSKITNMNNLFKNCSSLQYLPDISNWNTENVTDMSYLFAKCTSLIKLPDISKWNTNNVTNMSYLFFNSNKLISLPDISKWKINKVQDMKFMFYGLNNLESFPNGISKWSTNNVINMSSLFEKCSKITKLPDISKWNVNNVIDFNSMFYMCESLESVSPISNWKLQNSIKVERMFYGLKESVKIPDNFKKKIEQF